VGVTCQQRIIGVGDYAVSELKDQKLITYSLGSCIGLTLYDPTSRVGGLLHAQMPLSRMSPGRGEERPGMFVDTGVTVLLQTLLELGASRRSLIACVAGAAALFGDRDTFDIGRRNYMVVRKLLWKNKILLAAEDVGGGFSRTMWLEMATGRTRLKRQGTLLDMHPGSPNGSPDLD
jgi:chemotaxis protein CheD